MAVVKYEYVKPIGNGLHEYNIVFKSGHVEPVELQIDVAEHCIMRAGAPLWLEVEPGFFQHVPSGVYNTQPLNSGAGYHDLSALKRLKGVKA